MTELLVFLAVISGIWMLLRYLRKREIEAFRDVDKTVFEELSRPNRPPKKNLKQI